MKLEVYLIQVIAFVDLLAISLLIPLLSNHVRELGGSHIHVGFLGSIYAIFQLISGPLVGSLSDIKGQKTILIISLLICSFAYILIGITTSVFVILSMRAILGIFKQTQMLTKALVPDYERNEIKQSTIYGRMAAVSGAGITLGPIIGGHIMEHDPKHGITYIGVLVGVCFIINAALVYFLLPKKIFPSPERRTSIQSQNILNKIYGSVKQSLIELYKVEWSQYWSILMFKAFIGFAMSLYYSNYSLYLKNEYRLSTKYVGYVISFQGVIGAFSSYFMGYINSFYKKDKDYSQKNFHVFILLSISFIGLILSNNIYLYMLWLIPLAIGNAIGRLVTLEMILTRSHGDHRGTLIGASNSVRSLSGIIAPMISGFIGEYCGVSYVIYLSLVSTAIGLVTSYCYRFKTTKID